ncbi:3-isopropylmalate dehydratase small subunit [Actinoplanes sp. CA-054009]
MQPWKAHLGRAVALRRGPIDTDQIIPAEYCTRVTRTGLARGLFARWRAEPGFVLDDPRHAGATVLLAGPDFATGSSREHAVWALQDHGFAVVVSTSFGDIFTRNALRNGLLPVVLPAAAVGTLMNNAEQEPDGLVHVDLAALTVRAGSDVWDFAVDERARALLLDGRDAIDLTLERVAAVETYEKNRPSWFPRTSDLRS